MIFMNTTAKKFTTQTLDIEDIEKIRRDFPALGLKFHGKPLVYLDNGASAQKPNAVLEAMDLFSSTSYANVHRGVYQLSEQATTAFEEARKKIQHFINARENREIIFVKGTTEGINLVAQTFGRQTVKSGDEILISAMEHHSNIVPWQMLCEEKRAKLRVIPMNLAGELEMDQFEKLLNSKTKLVAIAHISNALGTINPIEAIIQKAHAKGIPVLIDGAQAVPHRAVDVQKLDCDFYVFSGHKLFGPTGIGVLFGKAKFLEAMPPYQGGGDMISSVSFEKTTYNHIPYKFEAGTPHIVGAVGLGAAIDYVQQIGLDRIASYEQELLTYATEQISQIKKVRLIGTASHKSAILSFILDEIHPHDVATVLDQEAIAVRAGHHCAQPVMKFYKVPATARASFAFYNTKEEIDKLVKGLYKVLEIFHV